MNRRILPEVPGSCLNREPHPLPLLQAALPKMKITRVRAYAPPDRNPLFNQSNTVVTIETDAGITGIGESGTPIRLTSAGRLMGGDPQYVKKLWQDMSRSFFCPPGRKKTGCPRCHSSLALWDLKGKVLGLPVHDLLGGATRSLLRVLQHRRNRSGIQPGMSLVESGRCHMGRAGYRCFRMGAADSPINTTYNTHQKVDQTYDECVQVREGVGKNGDWCIRFTSVSISLTPCAAPI